jgi:hypothetical protein
MERLLLAAGAVVPEDAPESAPTKNTITSAAIINPQNEASFAPNTLPDQNYDGGEHP